MDKMFVPRLGLLAVLGLAALLIGVIVLRSPDTHSNLWNGVRDGYARTEVGMVASGGQTAIAEAPSALAHTAMTFNSAIWLVVPRGQAAAITDPGQRLYIATGCAKCHGLEGQGGVVGPPLAGLDPQIIAAFARMGPAGMPAFSPDMLSDEELAEIGAYLHSMKPVPPVAAPVQEVTPTPAPPSTPTPTPLAEATATPGTPAPTPTPPPTSEAPSPSGNAATGKTIYAGKCAVCHGEGAAGKLGPSLLGLASEGIEKVVRQGKGAMPPFGASLLTDQELQDLLAYLHSLSSGGGASK